MSRILFTPRSARRIIAELKPVAERMCRTYRSLEACRPPRIASDQRVDPTYFRLLVDLCRLFESIAKAGARVKDPGAGLLEFPARRGGREVLLCWKVGESTLAFWHEPDEGFAGRRRVDEEGPWEEGPWEEGEVNPRKNWMRRKGFTGRQPPGMNGRSTSIKLIKSKRN